jgi:anaerobic magnesium-protoporphyrin IX monomethyl ester cyclase
VKAQLGPKTHWQDSDDLAMMFRGTYRSEFYRAVRDLLHEEVCLGGRAARTHDDVPAEARRALEGRWRQLLSAERQYRTGARGVVRDPAPRSAG